MMESESDNWILTWDSKDFGWAIHGQIAEHVGVEFPPLLAMGREQVRFVCRTLLEESEGCAYGQAVKSGFDNFQCRFCAYVEVALQVTCTCRW
jgi:hypothetical protein